jgi:hypothetical protein
LAVVWDIWQGWWWLISPIVILVVINLFHWTSTAFRMQESERIGRELRQAREIVDDEQRTDAIYNVAPVDREQLNKLLSEDQATFIIFLLSIITILLVGILTTMLGTQ